MSWSYDATKTEVGLHWVRLRIGDTDTNDPQLSDEEILSLLAQSDRVTAAYQAALLLSAKYARYGAQKEATLYATLAEQISREMGVEYL